MLSVGGARNTALSSTKTGTISFTVFWCRAMILMTLCRVLILMTDPKWPRTGARPDHLRTYVRMLNCPGQWRMQAHTHGTTMRTHHDHHYLARSIEPSRTKRDRVQIPLDADSPEEFKDSTAFHKPAYRGANSERVSNCIELRRSWSNSSGLYWGLVHQNRTLLVLVLQRRLHPL